MAKTRFLLIGDLDSSAEKRPDDSQPAHKPEGFYLCLFFSFMWEILGSVMGKKMAESEFKPCWDPNLVHIPTPPGKAKIRVHSNQGWAFKTWSFFPGLCSHLDMLPPRPLSSSDHPDICTPWGQHPLPFSSCLCLLKTCRAAGGPGHLQREQGKECEL